jgi:hypothetical protein
MGKQESFELDSPSRALKAPFCDMSFTQGLNDGGLIACREVGAKRHRAAGSYAAQSA